MAVSSKNYSNAYYVRRIIINKDNNSNEDKIELVMFGSKVPLILNKEDILFLSNDEEQEIKPHDFVVFSKGNYYLIAKSEEK